MTCRLCLKFALSIFAALFLFPMGLLAAGKLLIVHATVLTMKPGDDAPFFGYILVGEDGKIQAVGRGEAPAGTSAAVVYDARGEYVMPGFISAHSHLSESAFRGLATDQHVYEYPSLAGWVDALQTAELPMIPEDYYWYTLQGALDHLVHGITSVYNFSYARDNNLGFQTYIWKAELDSGIRFIHSYELSGDVSAAEHEAAFAKFYEFTQKDAANPQVLRLALSGWISSPRDLAIQAGLIRKYHLYSEIHYLESPANVAAQQANFKYIVEDGLLGPDVSFGHFIHTNDEILRQTAAAGSGMVWNPLSNGRLASGIADIPKYRAMGVRIGMGVDGEGSSDLPDPFENMRAGLYVIRAKYESAQVLQPIDVLRFHTIGSAQVLGVADKVGSLEPGKFGDILVIDTHLVERGPVRDPVAAIVLACDETNLKSVYVGGDLLVNQGKLTKSDMTHVSQEVAARVQRKKN